MSVHVPVDELADAAAGLLDRGRAAEIAAHLTQCPDCRRVDTDLRHVSQVLAAEPAPVMPVEVADRLATAVAAESDRRTLAVNPRPVRRQRSLGPFRARPAWSSRRVVGAALAAAAAAGAVGFLGYFVSASTGLNEPTATSVAVSSKNLGQQARALQESRDLDPHRFSAAWDCARQVTDGRITGIASAVVDGVPALLVYTRSDAVTVVTVVTGCDRGAPAAGPSTQLPR